MQRFGRQQRAWLSAPISDSIFRFHVSILPFQQAMSQRMQAAPVYACVLLKHAKVVLQADISFREQVMEELVHEVLPRGGNFWVR